MTLVVKRGSVQVAQVALNVTNYNMKIELVTV